MLTQLCRHDAVCELLRENGAALNMAGKVAGVFMCQVRECPAFMIPLLHNVKLRYNSIMQTGCLCWFSAGGVATYRKRSFDKHNRF